MQPWRESAWSLHTFGDLGPSWARVGSMTAAGRRRSAKARTSRHRVSTIGHRSAARLPRQHESPSLRLPLRTLAPSHDHEPPSISRQVPPLQSSHTQRRSSRIAGPCSIRGADSSAINDDDNAARHRPGAEDGDKELQDTGDARHTATVRPLGGQMRGSHHVGHAGQLHERFNVRPDQWPLRRMADIGTWPGRHDDHGRWHRDRHSDLRPAGLNGRIGSS